MSRTDTRKPSRIAEFLIVTFVVSWGCWALVLIHGGDYSSGINLPFFVLASFGPLLAALLMRLLHGRTIRTALRRPQVPVLVRGSSRRMFSATAPLASGCQTADSSAARAQPQSQHSDWATVDLSIDLVATVPRRPSRSPRGSHFIRPRPQLRSRPSTPTRPVP